MNKPKSIHFVGIKGVGVAPLAIIAKQAGIVVTGSDLAEEFITDIVLKEEGISPLVGFSKDHVGDVDLVITTGAHGGFDNEEVKAAREKNIRVMTQGQALGEFMKGEILGKEYKGISVTGSHGKTTTSAMISTVLMESQLDPSYVIGTASVLSLGSAGHFGTGEYFVAEADEYATEPKYDRTPKFMWQKPRIAVFTNIELDHPDLYPNVDTIRNAFLQFARQIHPEGVLVAYGDDPQVQTLLSAYSGKVLTYGYSPRSDYKIMNVQGSHGKTYFSVEHKGTSLGEFVLNVIGEHNALNALAALVVGLELGLSLEKIKKGLLAFKGSKRRAEFIAELPSKALLYDDYAHHPTEIKKTLHAFKYHFPDAKIVCIFQPHTFSRTKKLFEDFARAFIDTNTVILADIYASLRENPDSSVSSQFLTDAIRKFHKDAIYIPDLYSIARHIQKNFNKENTVIITMGAGDVYKIADELLRKK